MSEAKLLPQTRLEGKHARKLSPVSRSSLLVLVFAREIQKSQKCFVVLKSSL